MNIVQIGDKLRDLPISVLRSEDIVLILEKVNNAVPEGLRITAGSTGDDLYKLFNSVSGDVQTVLLDDVFTKRREALILSTIMEAASKQSRKDVGTGKKWGSVQGSIILISAAILFMVVWSFLSSFATKPPVPDAVVGNMVTELFKAGVDMLIAHLTAGS